MGNPFPCCSRADTRCHSTSMDGWVEHPQYSVVPQEGRLIGEQIAFIRSLFPNDRLSVTCTWRPPSARHGCWSGFQHFWKHILQSGGCSVGCYGTLLLPSPSRVVYSRSSSGLSQRVLTDCWISIDIRRLSTGGGGIYLIPWDRTVRNGEPRSRAGTDTETRRTYFSRRVSLSVYLRTCNEWLGDECFAMFPLYNPLEDY